MKIENSKNYIGAIMIAIAMLAFWIFVLPIYSSIDMLRQSLTDKKALYASRQDIINNIKKINDDYQKNLTDIEKISAIVATNRGVPEIISAIQAISARDGVQLTKISANDSVGSFRLDLIFGIPLVSSETGSL